MDGNHCLRGFSNRDIRQQLAWTPHLRQCGSNPKRAGAKVSRIFRRLRAHGLIAKIPRSRRWRVTRYGRRVMGAAHTCATTTSRANIPRWSHNLKSRQSSSQNAKKSQWKDLHSRTPRAFRGTLLSDMTMTLLHNEAVERKHGYQQ